MVVGDLNIVGIAFSPLKADPPLVVDPDTELALTVTAQFLQPVGRRDSQIIQGNGPRQHPQFSEGNRLHVMGQSPGEGPVEYLRGLFARKDFIIK